MVVFDEFIYPFAIKITVKLPPIVREKRVWVDDKLYCISFFDVYFL